MLYTWATNLFQKSHLFVIVCMGLRSVYIRFFTVCLRRIYIYNGPSQALIKHEVNEVERSLLISFIVVSKLNVVFCNVKPVQSSYIFYVP